MSVRLTLALLFVVPAAMAYPWQSPADRWLLGVAVAVVVVLFARWRGLFVTTIVARRIAMWRRRNHADGSHRAAGEFATVVLRVEPGEATDLPLELIVGYVERYGIRFDKVRVTGRDVAGIRTTWVSLTLGAADNLAALTARSPESRCRTPSTSPGGGWPTTCGRRAGRGRRRRVPGTRSHPAAGAGRETWRGVATTGASWRPTESVSTTGSPSILSEVWSSAPARSGRRSNSRGSRAHPALVAACAIRTDERPGSRAPWPGWCPNEACTGRRSPPSHRRPTDAPAAVPACRYRRALVEAAVADGCRAQSNMKSLMKRVIRRR